MNPSIGYIEAISEAAESLSGVGTAAFYFVVLGICMYLLSRWERGE